MEIHLIPSEGVHEWIEFFLAQRAQFLEVNLKSQRFFEEIQLEDLVLLVELLVCGLPEDVVEEGGRHVQGADVEEVGVVDDVTVHIGH